MKLRNTVIVVATVAMAAMIQPAQADISLASLIANNGTVTIGDKTFSGFSFSENGLTTFDPNTIMVSATESGGVDYLTWSGSIALASSGTAVGDLKLNYTVTASAGVINMIDQAYTGSAQNGGLLAVDETVSTDSGGVNVVGQSHLTGLDVSDPNAEANDVLNIVPPDSLLYVTKDISLATIGGIPPVGELVTISQVTQSFHQVPEPTTVLAGALLLLPLGASTLRILRRNRMS